MKKSPFFYGYSFAFAFLFLTACTKNDSTVNFDPSSVNNSSATTKDSYTVMASDATNIQNQDDLFESDARIAAEAVPNFDAATAAKLVSDTITVKGAVIDRSPALSGKKKFTLSYKGVYDSVGFKKTGSVTVALIKGNAWTEAGAVLQETFSNVSLTFGQSTKSYSGTRYVTNQTGTKASVYGHHIYAIRTAATVTLDDQSTRSYWLARKNDYFSVSRTNITFYSYGDTTINNTSCSMGGTSRYGDALLIKAPSAIAADYSCSFFPYTGKRTIVLAGASIDVLYGYDINGSLPANGACPNSYKVAWTKDNGDTGSSTVAYLSLIN